MQEEKQEENTQGINFFQLLSSTLFAAFGIQNRSNSQRDFTKGKPSQFIFAGILFTVLFVVGVILVVKMVLGSV
ncbi:MAG: DUF2970 domain-containing protein [Pseudomonadales bacterium]|nr:DUF2970 domain-containing protein [Pseudomonadales bacterium]